VPYQPFVGCLSWYFRNCPQAELRGQLANIGGGGELAPFVPELRSRIPDLPSLPPMDPEGQRYRLFEAVAAMLAVASRVRPMILMFDDLHWADKPTLLLLRHVMRSPRTASFTIVATYRESELDRPMREIAVSSSCRLRWATASSSAPEAVSATWRVVRSNNLTPSWVSNSRIKTLKPEGVINSTPAAREKLRCWATSRNARSWREVKSIIEYFSSIINLFELVL
jgi:AAA ATPase-like protein